MPHDICETIVSWSGVQLHTWWLKKDYSLANEFNRIREATDDLVFFFVHVLALGMHPATALGALNHPGVVVVVVVTALTKWTKAAFLPLQTTGGAERLRLIWRLVFGKMRHVCLATRVATKTGLATLETIWQRHFNYYFILFSNTGKNKKLSRGLKIQ